MSGRLLVGVMTGNCLDAVDAVAVDFGDGNDKSVTIIATAHIVIDNKEALAVKQLIADSHITIDRLLTLRRSITAVCAAAVNKLGLAAKDIAAVGCHGQTISHRPELGWTLQLLDGAALAHLTQCDVICDFRSRDVASGGQGAPLAPLFHHYYFQDYSPCDVINLGGIANISHVDREGVVGYDTGPGMMLMDEWCYRQTGHRFDCEGALAASGQVNHPLLQQWMQHPFFAKSPPKSTGRDDFSVDQLLSGVDKNLSPANIQATLSALTVETIVANIRSPTVFLCGGGSYNNYLKHCLDQRLATSSRLTTELGLAVTIVEAVTFAWLAYCYINNIAIKTAAVTGAGDHIAGACYRR